MRVIPQVPPPPPPLAPPVQPLTLEPQPQPPTQNQRFISLPCLKCDLKEHMIKDCPRITEECIEQPVRTTPIQQKRKRPSASSGVSENQRLIRKATNKPKSRAPTRAYVIITRG